MATKIVAEYAKSNRSTCKKCSETIPASTLRLGLHSKDPRGYEVTKWHHLDCFPTGSLQPNAAESIQGFSSLKSSDQEALEKLTAGIDFESKQGSDHGENEADEGKENKSEKKSSKKSKVGKVEEHEEEAEQTKIKVVAEYAKSNRSSCKQCAKLIPSKTVRVGLVSNDRGFDMTRWHHLKCLSTNPLQVDSVDEIDGFPSLKSNHQEALKKLLNGEPLPVEVLKEDEAALAELEAKSKTSKPSAKIVTEYAKSSRSSCKKCTEAIPAKSLRLGSVIKERGHDVTRWYHPDCFPTDSHPISSLDEIDGFSSLESCDQEALQKIMDGCDNLSKEVVVEGSKGQSAKKFKVRKTDETILDEGTESSSKKLKVAELEIAFSISDVKKQYKDVTLSPNWKAFQTLIFLERDEGLRDSEKIAAFDFDGCLANTDVKRIGADAWSLMFKSIPEKLNSLYKDGYKLVIFTNESNIERWKNKRQVAIDSKIGRLQKFIDCVKVPIQVFIACGFDSAGKGKDLFRKPNIGMWRLMEQQFNSGIAIDMDQIDGPAAYDVLTNFEQRWSKAFEYQMIKEQMKSSDDALLRIERMPDILGMHEATYLSEDDPETWHVQIFRSIDSNSVNGFPKDPKDTSKNLVCGKNVLIDMGIHSAYVKAIRDAEHFIYIENQYFLGSSYNWAQHKDLGANNLIPMEIALKIANKIRAGQRFAAYIVIPMWPEGVPTGPSTQRILYWQHKTMQMMYKIVHDALKEAGLDDFEHPQDYLNFFCLGNREAPDENDTDVPTASNTPQALLRKSRRLMIYVHSKGMIVDDEFVILGSANINQRSMEGTRDTEIAMGAYQPQHIWANKHSSPRGQVYGYRMSLWAEHIGGLEDCFTQPNSLDCVRRVRSIAESNWKQFAADEVTEMKSHLLKYPVEVERNGKVNPIRGCETFPDLGGNICGCFINIQENLTI